MRGKVIKGSTASTKAVTIGLPPTLAGDVPVAFDAAGPLDDPSGLSFDDVPLVQPQAQAPAQVEADLAAAAERADEIVRDAHATARRIVADADANAAQTVASAQADTVRVAEEARRGGYDGGYSDGLQAATDETRAQLDTLRNLCEAALAERRAFVEAAEPEVVRLAVGIAERVLHQQIALDPTVVVEMAKAALSRVVDRETITVRVNPADVAAMRAHRDELLALGDVKSMRVIEDQRVDQGGVVLETDAGSVDARVSTQLNEVRKILHLVDDVIVMQPADADADADADDALSPARAS